MKIGKKDLPRLFMPAALVVLSLVFAFFLPAAANRFRERMAREKTGSEEALATARDKVAEGIRDRQNLGIYQAAYRNLEHQGVIGNFSRMELVENLGKSGMDMQYSILPQFSVPVAEFFRMKVDRVEIRGQVLHEEKLIDLLTQIGSATHGLPLVEGCSLSRIEGASGGEPRLQASCAVSWITLEPLK